MLFVFEVFLNRQIKASISTSLGKAKGIRESDKIGVGVPIILPTLALLGFALLIILFVSLLAIFNLGNLIVTTLSTAIISFVLYGNQLLNKTAYKIVVVPFQKYLYLESAFGTLYAVPLKDVKAKLNLSTLTLLVMENVEVWIDLDTFDDIELKKQFLDCFDKIHDDGYKK